MDHPTTERPVILTAEQSRRLQAHGFTKGLAQALAEHSELFAQRIWILDNSGSMAIGDGQRVVQTSDGKVEVQPVPRWDELQQTALVHAELACTLQLPTHFRLLNYPGDRVGVQEFTVGEQMAAEHDGQDNDTPIVLHHQQQQHAAEELRLARTILQRTKPSGVTPLTDHLRHIERTLRMFAHELQQSDKQVALVLATDGLPTDSAGDESPAVQNEFVRALKGLEDLPVWIVVRLCTNQKEVCEFYNSLDAQLELSLEVLDDHTAEAKEVAHFNKWLNYGLPLHRCRELGFQHRLLDLLDERALTIGEVQEFCGILFSPELVDTWPDPAIELPEFCASLNQHLQQHETPQWDPTKSKMLPWINTKALQQVHGKKKRRGFLGLGGSGARK